MKLPGKGTLLAILLVFSPGIAFAVFELFFSPVAVKPRTKLFGWASLAVGVACVVALVVVSVREALQRKKLRQDQS